MRMGMVGPSAGRPPRDGGEVWLVFHTAVGWTHLYRIDPRDPRTVHLERAAEGDRVAALRAFALRRLGVAEPAVAQRIAA